MTGELFDVVIGPRGFPLDDDAQPEAPWACTGCASRRGFRRRGQRPGGRTVLTKAGRVRLAAWQVECRRCGRRFVPVLELLGLAAFKRRSAGVAEMAAALATEVAYAKAARLLAELAGIDCSARTVRRDTLSLAPDRVGPERLEVPVLLLDGTGVRAGDPKTRKNGVELHLAVGLVARRREGGRVVVETRLLGATVGESWTAMGELLAGVRPGLVIVDGEEAITDLAIEVFGTRTPIQRCLFHLERQSRWMARYLDRLPADVADELQGRLHELLTDAYATGDVPSAVAAYNTLIDTAESLGADHAATHLLGRRTPRVHLRHPPDSRPAPLRRQGPPRARHRGPRTGHAGDEPAHRRRGPLVHRRRPQDAHGQARTQVPSRTVVNQASHQRQPQRAVQPRRLAGMSANRLTTQRFKTQGGPT